MAHPLLLYYVKKAEEMELGIDLTLYVRGLIVEGITLSRNKYYEEIQAILTSGTPTTTTNDSSADKLDKVHSSLQDFILTETEKEKTEFSVPEYIYLKDVKIYRGSPNDFVFTQHWVCNLSSVDAFSIGHVTYR
jgi:hypothetical protein